MTEHEINRIRQKFILLSTLTLFVVMFLMGGCIYLFSTITIRNEAMQIMRYIAENDGELPAASTAQSTAGSTGGSATSTAQSATGSTAGNAQSATGTTAGNAQSATGTTGGNAQSAAGATGGSAAAPAQSAAGATSSAAAGATHAAAGATHTPAHSGAHHDGDNSEHSFSEEMEWSLEGIFGVGNFFGETPEFTFTTRYFAVLFAEDGSTSEIKASHIAYINEEQAEEYARIALKRRLRFGSFGRYYYYCAPREAGGTIVIYLDRTAQITLVNRVLFSALSILGLGTLLAFFFMRLFSKDVVRSEIENMEKQKQFITNASHELKTPLAVIRANTEMQEMLDGETEWTQSTLRQVERMSGLIANLVQIARAQEKADGALKPIDIVPAVSETADSFVPVAASEGKKLEKEVPASLVLKADESRIRQLTSLLADNAVKYCDNGGTIRVALAPAGKRAVLTVSNDYAEGANVDYTRFFERFYRQDQARTISSTPSGGSSGKNGYGIGLSIAESLVKSMNGTIDVSWKDGKITFTCKI